MTKTVGFSLMDIPNRTKKTKKSGSAVRPFRKTLEFCAAKRPQLRGITSLPSWLVISIDSWLMFRSVQHQWLTTWINLGCGCLWLVVSMMLIDHTAGRSRQPPGSPESLGMTLVRNSFGCQVARSTVRAFNQTTSD